MKDLEGVEHLDSRCEKRGETMSNPIPSAMVYFDEKERRAVLCLDESLLPPAVVSACSGGEGHEFHTHTWAPLGWTTEAAFMATSGYPRDFAANIVYEMMFSVVKIRDDFDRMRHERDVVREINERLLKISRVLEGEFSKVIPFVESEKERRRLFGIAYDARQHLLTGEDGEEN